MKAYRAKIYQYYSSRRIGNLAPASVEGFKPRQPYFDRIIKRHFPLDREAKVLELGCGHGAFLHSMHQAGYRNAAGVDGSEEQINEAMRLGIKNIKKGNLIDYLRVCEEESLDVIVAFDVIEHFTKDELSQLVDDLYRVIKKGGRFICHQPNSEGPFGNFMRDWDFTHETGFTRQSIAQLFLASGFSSIQSYEDKPIVHGVKSMVRFVLWEYFIRSIYNFFVLVETGARDKNSIYSMNFLSVVQK